MRVDLRRLDRFTVVSIEGEAFLADAERLRWELFAALHDPGSDFLIVDLRLMEAADAFSLAALLEAHLEARRVGTHLAFAEPTPLVRSLFRCALLDRECFVFRRFSEAVEVLGSPGAFRFYRARVAVERDAELLVPSAP